MRGLWLAIAAATLSGAAPPADELLWHHRNLGKAFYENPATQYEAVEQFQKALELGGGSARDRLNLALALLKAGKTAEGIAELQKVQAEDPSLPHSWFNLGIAWKRDSRYDLAIVQFRRMVELVPDEPISHFNLGTLLKLTGQSEEALAHFERAAALAPHLAGPHFQLWNAYKAVGRSEDAGRELAIFKALKKAQEGAAVPEDLEWSWYSEIYDDPPATPPASAVEPKWEIAAVAENLQGPLLALDLDGDEKADLMAGTATGLALFAAGKTQLADTGLDTVGKVLAVAPADFDNDGRVDLAISTETGVVLYRQTGAAGAVKLERFAASLPAAVSGGRFAAATWLDYDHDYDPDLLLFGERPALLRNPGAGSIEGWTEQTASFPFVAGQALATTSVHLVSDTQGLDLAVSYATALGVLYRDRLGGKYEAVPLPELPAGAPSVAAIDLDADGWMDLEAGGTALLNQRGKSFAAATGPPERLAWLDPDLSGRPRAVPLPAPGTAVGVADFDGDGKEDLALLEERGTLRLARNATPTTNRSLSVRLRGLKNPKLAPGSEVEVKAGRVYHKQTYRGLPLVFGVGAAAEVDTVRITWGNGLVQNETRQATGRLATFEEAPRLSGSCPMIFAWNGARFEFVTDVLGVAPLGASAGDGNYFPVDHDEHIELPDSMVEKDGRFELRITEELREVAYLDEVKLIAVDHPEEHRIFVNDKFQDPPFPELAIHSALSRIPPIAASDHRGTDVLSRLLAKDRIYPDAFPRDPAGVGELHHLDLDFGAVELGQATLLVLSGWVDWADGSTFLATAQRPGGGLVMPRLLVKDTAGQWVTAIASMGLPAGKPKTIVVDVSNLFVGRSRELRIETSLALYWDEIFLAEAAARPEHSLTSLAPERAELRFRGFSKPTIHPERKQPERFDYQSFLPQSMWNPTPGLYTRFGDVLPLLAEVDDRLVIMGSGDEIQLSFDASRLPPLLAGHRRSFLLKVDGWAKDGDANTGHSQTVEPLPFHGMSQYPYPEGEAYPSDPEHEAYRKEYNTRPALRILRPLAPERDQP